MGLKTVGYLVLSFLNWSVYVILTRFLAQYPETKAVPFVLLMIGFLTSASLLKEAFRELRENDTSNSTGVQSADKGKQDD